MFVLCENATSADIPAINKAATAANNTTTNTDSGNLSGSAVNLDAFKTLEKMLIDYKPGKSKLAIKKVEIGCPVQLKNHVELFFDNVYDIISGAVVDFDCILPTEISYHNEKEVTVNKRTVIVIATRTYFVMPKQPLPDLEFSLQLEHRISSMAEKKFDYQEPHLLESRPLQAFEIVCSRMEYAAELLIAALKNPFRKISPELKESFDHTLDGISLLSIDLHSYDNILEELVKQKEENEKKQQQLEQKEKELDCKERHLEEYASNLSYKLYRNTYDRLQELESQNKEINDFTPEHEERDDW